MNVLVSGFGLIEGPVWHAELGLLFADAGKGGAFLLNRKGVVSTVFEHRRGIGGMAWHEQGGLIVSGRNVAYKAPGAAATIVLLHKDPDHGLVGFNDLTTDAGFITPIPETALCMCTMSSPTAILAIGGSLPPPQKVYPTD
jgi:sugar lactone lactonase YvrE